MPDGPRLPGVERDEDEEDPIILHVDADCFYAACERLREPELEGEPLVVGMGYEPGETVGAVATASYEAREFGVESAQAISSALERLPRRAALEGEAQRASENSSGARPERSEGLDEASSAERRSADRSSGQRGGGAASNGTAKPSPGPRDDREERPASGSPREPEETGHYRPVDMDYYESVAEEVQTILHECADVVREVSIDEAYLDVTERTAWEVADGFARHVKDRIRREVGIVVSVGAAPTMSAAKIASDYDKPDGLTVVRPGELREFLAPLEVDLLHGVGPVTARELREMGLETAGDVAAADPDPLVERFGERGRELYDRARGDDDRRVEPKGDPKSFSRESAFSEPVEDPEPKYEQIETLAAAVADRAQREEALYRTVGVKAVTPPYDVNTRERSLPGPIDDPALVDRIAQDLFAEFETEPVRKVGVRVANLEFSAADQASLDGWERTGSDGDPDEQRRPDDGGTDGDGTNDRETNERTATNEQASTDKQAPADEQAPMDEGRPAGQSSLEDFS